jgi:hypothetical protein
MDADFADFADLFAGLAYLPGAYFCASTTQATVCVRGSFAMPHFEASENSSAQVWFGPRTYFVI